MSSLAGQKVGRRAPIGPAGLLQKINTRRFTPYGIKTREAAVRPIGSPIWPTAAILPPRRRHKKRDGQFKSHPERQDGTDTAFWAGRKMRGQQSLLIMRATTICRIAMFSCMQSGKKGRHITYFMMRTVEPGHRKSKKKFTTSTCCWHPKSPPKKEVRFWAGRPIRRRGKLSICRGIVIRKTPLLFSMRSGRMIIMILLFLG